eukprot:scaffold411_cov73-Isochrysis_galbana.AAC.1
MLREVVALFDTPGLLPLLRVMGDTAEALLHRKTPPPGAPAQVWLEMERKGPVPLHRRGGRGCWVEGGRALCWFNRASNTSHTSPLPAQAGKG